MQLARFLNKVFKKKVYYTINGISGINISEIIIALLIFFLFLLLRGLFAKFIIKRLEKYVSKTTNRFDNSLVESLKGPTKFFPIVIGFFIEGCVRGDRHL